MYRAREKARQRACQAELIYFHAKVSDKSEMMSGRKDKYLSMVSRGYVSTSDNDFYGKHFPLAHTGGGLER